MPVASFSVTKSLLADDYTAALGGQWFAWFTAALMLGAAVGGSLLGNLGDRIGRTRAMGLSILFYSLFAGLGAFVKTPEQMLVLRFLVGLGVGGMWPNGVALVAECWPAASRPTVSGILGAGINVGILALSQLVRVYPITPDSWRWIFMLAGIPAALGVLVLTLLPESPKWLASRSEATKPAPPLSEMFRGELLRPTLIRHRACVRTARRSLGRKQVDDSLGRRRRRDCRPARLQSGNSRLVGIRGYDWQLRGAPVAAFVGRRISYFLISLGATVLTWSMFRWTAPLETNFLYVVFAQGLVATLFFGWLPLYLPELYPVQVRATGAGLAMNIGRFATAGGVLAAGSLFTFFESDYSAIGAACALIYAIGMLVIVFAPKTKSESV